jgi:hypothetical protein
MTDLDRLLDRCMALSPGVRYAAVSRGGAARSRQRSGLAHASGSESDRYEELLVNPTLVTLLRQRGEIDCGGLDYVLVRYGHFFQLVVPVSGGHVSVAIEPEGDVLKLAASLVAEISQWAAGSGRP